MMWIYLAPYSTVRCACCAAKVHFGQVEMFINAEYLRSGRLQYACDCGRPFATEDFIRSGASMIAQPVLSDRAKSIRFAA